MEKTIKNIFLQSPNGIELVDVAVVLKKKNFDIYQILPRYGVIQPPKMVMYFVKYMNIKIDLYIK